MTKAELDKKIEEVCNTSYPDMEEIKKLILAGADMNRENKFGESIFRDTFVDSLYRFYDYPSTEEEKKAGFNQVKDTIKFMLEHGWDGWEYGLDVMDSFFVSFYDIHVFDMFRFFLQFDWYDDDAYKLLLLDALSEEHSQAEKGLGEGENVFYAIYEMIYARMDGRNYESIEPYHGAIGQIIDKVIYFAPSDTTVQREQFAEYYAEIGFVCGEKLLVLRDNTNILFMNDRLSEEPQTDISDLFGARVIGQTIQGISFRHGDSLVTLELNNGTRLSFKYVCSGEYPDWEKQYYFWIE